ncbi:MAG: hypothetical protein JPMHGGIA_00229 [Saprospiraceae bacterium]|jgi:hypothetical protein|nr:hypothetical protein [Saprospiraceae bacterium]
MAIDFDHYSYLFSEEELFEFKQLIDAGAVMRANQIRLNLWNYLLRMDGIQLECELGFNTKTIKSVLCACGHRGTTKLCRHAKLLALWHITRIYQRQSPRTDVSSKLLESLRNSKQEDLCFLTELSLKYDQRLKDWFALFIKASDSSPEELEQQWALVTDFLRQLNLQIKSKIGRERKYLLLGQTYYQLALQQFAKGELARAAVLLIITHRLALYLLRNFEPVNPARFAQLASQTCHALDEVLKGIIAPESREFFITRLSEEVSKDEYFPHDASNNLFVILLSIVQQSSSRESLKALLQEKCLKAPFDAYVEASWNTCLRLDPEGFAALFIQLPEHKKMLAPNVAGFIATHYAQIPGSQCFELIRSLTPRLNDGLQKMLAQIFPFIGYKPISVHEFQFAAELYAKFPDPGILQWLFSSPENRKEKGKWLLQAIDDRLDNIDSRNELKYEVLYHGAFHQELVDRLIESGNIHAIMQYDHRIDPALRLKLFSAFKTHITDYRLHNAGPKAKREVRRLLLHLDSHYRTHLPPGLFKNITAV